MYFYKNNLGIWLGVQKFNFPKFLTSGDPNQAKMSGKLNLRCIVDILLYEMWVITYLY